MFQKDQPSWEIRLPIVHCDEEDLHFSCQEKENFNSFRAMRESSKVHHSDSVQTPSSKPKPLIQKVPSILRENRDFKKYFEPRVVAIGPLHHGNPRLERAEKAKLKLAVQFTDEHKVSEQVLYRKIKEKLGDLKKYYMHNDIEKYDDEKLAWMFFVDGCAVLHAIHYYIKEEKQKELNIKVDLLAFAQQDLFMLENQLPFQVLELLLSSVQSKDDLRNSINVFIDDNIKETMASGSGTDHKPTAQQDHEHVHLLGLLRERLLVYHKSTTNNNKKTKMDQPKKTFRSINELKEAGIHVRPSETSSLRDVNFSVGILGCLRFPRIVVDDSTGSKFMNLVAYEMCPDFENDFGVTSYLCFLDSLIDTAKDVKELRHSGMLLNYMGSDEEVAYLFNTITTDLPDMQIYREVTQKIVKYCDNPWRTSIAKFYYTHFNTPWSIGGFVGAVMGLVFTAIQAYYSMQKKRHA